MSAIVLQLVQKQKWAKLNDLLDSNAPNEHFISNKQRVLAEACSHNQTQIVEKLLQRNIEPTNRMLYIAIEKGYEEIGRLLLASKKIELGHKYDRALMLAIEKESFEIANLILLEAPYVNESSRQIVMRLLAFDASCQLKWILLGTKTRLQYCEQKGWIKTFFEMECKRMDRYFLQGKNFAHDDLIYRQNYSFGFVKQLNLTLSEKGRQELRSYQNKHTHQYAIDPYWNNFYVEHDMQWSMENYFIRLTCGFNFNQIFTVAPVLDRFNKCWQLKMSNIFIGHWLSKDYLVARGYLVETILRKSIRKTQHKQLKREIKMAINLTLALRQLDMPVLILQELFYVAVEPAARCIDAHMSWTIIQTAKNELL